MSEQRSSSDLQSLIEAAKADGPSTTSRAQLWTKISETIGGAAAVGQAATAMRSMGAAKMLAVGALLGGPVLVGLAGTFLYVGPRTTREAGGPVARIAPAISNVVQAVAAERGTRSSTPPETGLNAEALALLDETTVDHLRAARDERPPLAVKRPVRRTPWTVPLSSTDARRYAVTSENDLTREAALVADARSALAAGDAARASRSIHATMAIGRRQLVPEELALEVKALRALGRFEQAKTVKEELKKHYPDSALAR